MRTSLSRFQAWMSEWNDAKTRQLLVVVLAVLLGVLIGMSIYLLSKWLANEFWSYPPGLYLSGPDAHDRLLKDSALQIFICTTVSWAVGTLAGGYVSVRLAKLGQFPAWIAGVILASCYWIDLLFQPHTLLQFVLCPFIVAACAWGGGWLGAYMNFRKVRQVEPADA